jgi:hypothetical protein
MKSSMRGSPHATFIYYLWKGETRYRKALLHKPMGSYNSALQGRIIDQGSRLFWDIYNS